MMDRPAPIEVVSVTPRDVTVNQLQHSLAVTTTTVFVAPLGLRALARHFGIELSYWKCVRIMYAGRLVVIGLGLNRPLPQAGIGKTLREKRAAVKLANTRLSDLPTQGW